MTAASRRPGGRSRAAVSAAGAALVLASLLVLVGCGAPGPLMPDQRPQTRSAPPPPPAPSAYTVRRGDTLYSIAFRFGLDWREVARWNRIQSPYTIRVGQRLDLRRPPSMERVDRRPAASNRSPAADRTPAESSRPRAGSSPSPSTGPATAPASEPEPVRSPSAPVSTPPRATPPASTPAPSTSAGSTAPVPTAATRQVDGVEWRWPTAGNVARGFNAGDTRKGILIAGTPGQPVRAAASGTVVYSGSGLIGYGELIIVKHNDRMLSAYAHNRSRGVAEGEAVRAGQEIATLGRNERDEAVLHFEIRRDGQPVDPVGFLPRR